MTPELRDEIRKRWVLYTNQDEQSADCAKYPFESIPGRVFLDTNVVNLIVKWPEQVFENVPPPSHLDERTAHDIEALMHVFFVGQRASWDLVASSKTIEEISKTVDDDIRSVLLDYAIEVADEWSDESRYGRDLGRRLADSSLLAALPDLNDRELIGNAIGMDCDVFCTRDLKTIIRRRHRLPKLPLRILSPTEWWSNIKPWAGLWS